MTFVQQRGDNPSVLAFIGSAYTVYTIECSLQQPTKMVKLKEKGQGLC